jgi:excisionase family DNA binding protein
VTEIELVTIEEAGRRLGVSRSSAYRLMRDGELPVVDMARKGSSRPKLRVRVDRLIELVERRTLTAA